MTETNRRARSAAALFAGVAVSAMGFSMMAAYIPLAAEDLLGEARWSGAPSALGTMGVALGTTGLSLVMARGGRRRGLVLGYLGAGAAALVAALAAASGTFSVLAAAIFFVGAGYSANRLSRYAAADLYEPSRKGAAIGWNVWAASIGSVVGPLLLTTTRRGSQALHVPEAMGPFFMSAVAFGISGILLRFLFPSRTTLTGTETVEAGESATAFPGRVRLSLVSLVSGQVVMVLIMTMTPIHIRHGGHDLGSVGVVFAAHTFGMYALSPLAGFLTDRLGSVTMIAVAVVLLFSGGAISAGADPGSAALAIALFLLGLGWSVSFVAASALLTASVPAESRIRIQGFTDSLVWGSAAVAGLASGVLLSEVGYATLSRLGSVLSLLPLLFLFHATKKRVG